MDDLHARARAFVIGPCVICEHWFLIHRYVDGELRDDPEAQNLLSQALQTAQTEIANLEAATSGPACDALFFYHKAAAFLEEIKAELSADEPVPDAVIE